MISFKVCAGRPCRQSSPALVGEAEVDLIISTVRESRDEDDDQSSYTEGPDLDCVPPTFAANSKRARKSSVAGWHSLSSWNGTGRATLRTWPEDSQNECRWRKPGGN
jgi:hypothetical protein